MADLHDHHDENGILDLIDDPVWPLADPIPLLSGQLLAARRAGILCQGIKTSQERGGVLPGKTAEIFGVDLLRANLSLPMRLQVLQ